MGGMIDIGKLIAHERGDLSDKETLELFAELIRTGLAWRLQGHYGRTAAAFINEGFITPVGEVEE
jgi:hypothetical protein